MARRTKLMLIAVGLVLFLAGCGPTKAGMKNREEARDRMSLVNAQISYDQAKQSFEVGQFDRALREINNAIARYSKSADYYLLQGRIYLETHRLEEAIAAFKTALETKVDFAEAHYYTGIVYQRWSDDELAYEHYLKASEVEPSNVQYVLAAAESMIALGEFDAAWTLIDSKLAYFEHNGALRQLQGQIALLRGDPAQAVKLYTEARLLNPDDNALLEELMWAQYSANLYGQCHETVKTLQARTKTERIDLIHLEARCLTLMGRNAEARDLYMKMTSLSPSDPVLWSELGALAWDLGDYRRVATCSVRVIALAPHRYEGYMLKGINERHAGRIDEALELFREAASYSTDAALPHLLLGQTLEQRGDVQGALAAYTAATEVEPENPEAQRLRNRVADGSRVSSVPTD